RMGLEALMRQQAVETERDSETSGDPPQDHGERESLPTEGPKAQQRRDVHCHDESRVEPVEASGLQLSSRHRQSLRRARTRQPLSMAGDDGPLCKRCVKVVGKRGAAGPLGPEVLRVLVVKASQIPPAQLVPALLVEKSAMCSAAVVD